LNDGWIITFRETESRFPAKKRGRRAVNGVAEQIWNEGVVVYSALR
jgi:hypothetical protein